MHIFCELQHLMQDKCLYLHLVWKLSLDKNAQDTESSWKFYTSVQMQDLLQPFCVDYTGKFRVAFPRENK